MPIGRKRGRAVAEQAPSRLRGGTSGPSTGKAGEVGGILTDFNSLLQTQIQLRKKFHRLMGAEQVLAVAKKEDKRRAYKNKKKTGDVAINAVDSAIQRIQDYIDLIEAELPERKQNIPSL